MAIKTFFKAKTNNWYNTIQYATILLAPVAFLIRWRIGLFFVLVFVISTIVKLVADRKVGNPAIKRPLQMALYSPVVYLLVLAISLLWSNDLATGLNHLFRKAVLLIFPLCFLLSNTTYLTPRHLRGMGYVWVAAVCGSFICLLIAAVISKARGVDFYNFYFADFFAQDRVGGYRHHAYIALYAVAALIFIYHELSTYWKEMKVWHRVLLIFFVFLLLSYIVLVNSRAGIITTVLVGIACVVHLSIMKRSKWLGIVIASFFLVGLLGSTMLFPTYTDRVSKTVRNIKDDTRFPLYHCNWDVICNSSVVGYGIGDYHSVQMETYEKCGFEVGVLRNYNAHNQYMEDYEAAGFVGLGSLLLFLLSAFIIAVCRRSRYTFIIAVFTAIVMINLLFESMLERQMGLIFIGGLYAVMVLMMCVEEKQR